MCHLLMAAIALCLTMVASGPTALLAQNQSGITSPSSGDSVSGDVIVAGTAVIEPFLRYELYYKQEPNSDDAYIYFDGGTSQVTNGQLGIWRTSDLAPGTYSLRLRVVKTDGNYGEFVASNLRLNAGAAETETPTPTATSSEPTPTPIPTATFTPAPQPTPIVGQVAQPTLENPAIVTSPTPVAAGVLGGDSGNSGDSAVVGESNTAADDSALTFEESNASSAGAVNSTSITRQIGETVAVDRLRQYFFTGMRFSALLILGITILFVGKWAVRWVWTQYR